ncbi:PP2C family protein-serine/threonine phosphatase [Streptomyces sp. NPDC086122]|uniref:PP2C family protein-serine/threonine phosphatase n=1 Tax=Streptomyces sp. NPDC086122 TaxID=3155294 RepID=UPI0034307873
MPLPPLDAPHGVPRHAAPGRAGRRVRPGHRLRRGDGARAGARTGGVGGGRGSDIAEVEVLESVLAAADTSTPVGKGPRTFRVLAAEAARGIGGDWFDAIPLPRGRTALVVGDVMGHGINAAATMGQLRTATRALAGLELPPDQVLRHLDRVTADLHETTATCVYAVVDPVGAPAASPWPVIRRPPSVHPGRAPRLLDLPTGAPLGVGGVPFRTALLELHTFAFGVHDRHPYRPALHGPAVGTVGGLAMVSELTRGLSGTAVVREDPDGQGKCVWVTVPPRGVGAP